MSSTYPPKPPDFRPDDSSSREPPHSTRAAHAAVPVEFRKSTSELLNADPHPSPRMFLAQERTAAMQRPPEARPRSRATRQAAPLTGVAPLSLRMLTMAGIAWRMIVHNRAKSGGTIFGIMFGLLLTNQQVATLDALLSRNCEYLDQAHADIFIVPQGTQRLQGGSVLPIGALMEARVTQGVDWAEPIVWGMASLKLPNGGAEPVTLIGTRLPKLRGGPYNMVAGTREVLAQPDTIILEDSRREKFGNVNLGDARELNGHRVVVGGFTWGLLPFAAPYAFAEYDLARELLQVDSDRVHYVIVGLQPGADAKRVQRDLQQRIPEAAVRSYPEMRASTMRNILIDEGVGGMIANGLVVSLIVGFSIVSLTMFSAVVENIREYATLKAMGATNLDLAFLLVAQALFFSMIGAVLGTALTCASVLAMRSPALNLVLHPIAVIVLAVVMTVIAVLASGVALLRLRSVEPASVFR